jgi:type IV secretory pathway VirD2 relaxase
MNLAGAARAAPRQAFQGNRIGRGCGVGRVLAGRDRLAAFRQRRVIIKSRIVKLAGKGLAGARAHLRYIQRDGVTRDGERGALYGPGEQAVDGKAFHERSAGDRHQFRFIVSPEDGGDYDSLRSLTSRLMSRMEEDLGTRLEWVAVDHFNTGHPHTHIMLRGVDDRGRDLVIAREYLSTGMRERAAEIVELDLGPRSDLEIERRLAAEVEQERFTSLDRRLLANADAERMVSPPLGNPARQTLLAGRLRKLEALGLAEEERPGRWRLPADFEKTLRRLAERGDIIKTMHRELRAAGLEKASAELAVFDAAAAGQRPVVGRVVSRGLSDELADGHFLIVDSLDGRAHFVDVGKGEAIEPLPAGAIVRIEGRNIEARTSDRIVAEIAAANEGRYSVDIHLRHDRGASQAFAEAHIRRLEALRRGGVGVERLADGTWLVAADHLERAAGFERAQARSRPVALEVLSHMPIEALASYDGSTWLDRELVANGPEPLRDAGFGKAVREAQQLRRRWLVDQALASEQDGTIAYRPDFLATLRRRELMRVAAQLSGELGMEYSKAETGQRINGTLCRTVETGSGRYALIERARDFTLVPWRPILDRRVGQRVEGLIRSNGISWSFGRDRGGPTISG